MAESIQTLDSWAHMSFPGRQNFTHVTIHCWKNDAHPLWLCWERTLRKLAPAFLQTLPHVPFFSCWFCFVSFWQNKSCTEFYKFLSLIKEPTGGLGYHPRIIILILHSPFDWFSLRAHPYQLRASQSLTWSMSPGQLMNILNQTK